jgi:hypothetical protein
MFLQFWKMYRFPSPPVPIRRKPAKTGKPTAEEPVSPEQKQVFFLKRFPDLSFLASYLALLR